jgi:uncharacterized repeat protein (TIGR01451 family)
MKQGLTWVEKRLLSKGLLIFKLLAIVAVVTIALQWRPHEVIATVATCSTGAAAQNGISVAPSHGQSFYIDTGASPKLDAGYIGYRVTNSTGSTQNDLWTEATSFTGGVLGLANSLDKYQQVTTLTNTSTAASYFLLKANAATTTPQAHRLKVWNGRPDLPGSALLYDCQYTFTAVKETIKAAANKVSDTGYSTSAAIEVSDTTPELGQAITISVEGTSGTIGAGASPDGSIVWLTPAAVSSWPTRALRLESVSVTFERGSAWTGGNSSPVTYTDQLMISNAQNCLKKNANPSTCTGGTGSSSPEYRAFYTFRVVGMPAASVKAVPVAQIASGTQIKHADTTAVGSTLDISFSSVSINASLAKSVTSTTGLQTVTCGGSCSVPGGVNGTTYVAVPYRITATSSTATTVSIDEIVDQPATGVIFKPSSATITDIGRTAVAIDDPSYIASESGLTPRPIHFTGPFNFNSGTSVQLNYVMWVPSGSYTNTAFAKIGDLLIGASTTAMSKVVVTSDGSGTVGVVVTTESLGVVISTDQATSITSSTGTMNGTIDPNGATPLTAQFEYSTNSNLSGSATVTATTPASGTVSGLTAPTLLAYSLTGLTSNTTYYYRAVAGANQGSILSFTTDAVLAPPTVTTVAATGISSTGATLNGTINPNLTSVLGIQYIYGTSATLASGNTTVTLDDGAGGNLTASGASAQPFPTTVGSLSNGTTYYYKIRGCTVSNCSTFVDGSILSFVAQNPPSNPVLAVTKTEDDADNSVTPGQTVSYTITIANSGGVTGNTSFTDAIPTGMGTPGNFSYTNCGSPSSGFSAPTLTISSLTITNADNCIVSYTVTISNPLNQGTTLTNSVDVAAATEGGNNPSAVAASTLTVDATPNLSTSTKTVSDVNGGTVEPGDTLTYTLTIKNTGDGQATGVSATDTIDTDTQNLTSVSRSGCGSSTNSSTSTQLNVTGITVAVGADCVIGFSVSVKTPLNESTAITNTATISAATEGGSGATPSSSTLTVDATPALSVTHSENDADNSVLLNQVVTYTITIQNTGNGQATSVTASSTVDIDASLNTGSFGYTNCGSPSNASTSSSLSLSAITIAAGQTCTITYTATVSGSASNGATILSAVDVGPATEGGNNPTAVSATTLTVVVLAAPSGLYFQSGVTNLGCSGTTGTRAVHLVWSAVSGATDYNVSLDNGSAISSSTNTYYDWTIPAVDGVHTFKVQSVDAGSNASAWSATCQITLDQTNPTVDAGTNKSAKALFTQSSSSASDGGSGISSYAWTKVSGPGTANFSSSSVLHPDITATVDGTYVLRLTVTDNVGNSANDTFTLIWDTTPPVVTLLGSVPLVLTVGDTFSEPGATALDNIDGNVTSSIIITNNVNTAVAGSYTITYEVSDALGNTTIVTRTVTVVADTSSDNDGASTGVEQAAPNNGDANNDGVADKDQSTVTSLLNPATTMYAALENTSSCQNTNVSLMKSSDVAKSDIAYTYPAGLMNFTLVCTVPGATAHVVQYFYGIAASNIVARKYDNNNQTYITITNAVITRVTIGGQDAVKIAYDIVDGGPLDEDGLVNGTIIDPSGPAVLGTSVLAPNTGLQPLGLREVLAQGLLSVLILGLGVYLGRHRLAPCTCIRSRIIL